METDQLTVYKDVIVVWPQNHTKYIPLSTLCGQNVEFLTVKRGGTYSNHWALKGK